MKKILCLIFVILFFSGCSVSLPENTSSKEFDTPDYKKGHNGLELSLNKEIDEIFVGDFVMLNLNVLNNGAYEINNGIIKLAMDDDYLEALGDSRESFSLQGKSVSAPDGEGKTFSFRLKAKDIESMSLEQDANIYFTGCYNYKTEKSIDVCIDADIYQVQEKKSCEPEKINLGGGQGAPIEISSVETKMIYDDEQEIIIPTFIIEIKNKGDGTIFREGREEAYCSPTGIDQNDLNVVDVQAKLNHKNGMYPLVCVPEGDVKLIDGERTVVCKDFEGFSLEDGTFQTPLNIKLEYGYTTILSNTLKIKKLQ
jgi:hypothetical protein